MERRRRFGEVYLGLALWRRLKLDDLLGVSPEGLPLAYEVFDGNRTDVTTVDEIVEMMRNKYGHERRTWVMDRGMVSEDNLEMLREAKGCPCPTNQSRSEM